MTDRFTPENFYLPGKLDTTLVPIEACDIANKWLEARLGMKVYGQLKDGAGWDTYCGTEDTHEGRIFCPQEIKPKEECLHLNRQTSFTKNQTPQAQCINCGKQWQAKWEVVEWT